MLMCGVNGALTRADENEVGEQQLTPRAPLNCQSPARRSKPLDFEGGKEIAAIGVEARTLDPLLTTH